MAFLNCVVKSCASLSDSDQKTLHKFPEQESELFDKWCHNLGLEKTTLNSYSRVCARHFDSSCLGKKKLKLGAVPTLYLDNKDELTLQMPVLSAQQMRRKTIRKCSIQDCGSTSMETTIHTFPTDAKRRQSWVEACNLPNNIKNFFICGKHFDKDFVRPRKLSSLAFPKFFLTEPEVVYESIEIDEIIKEEEEEEEVCEQCHKFWELADYHKKQHLKCQEELKARTVSFEKAINKLQEKNLLLVKKIKELEDHETSATESALSTAD